MTVGLISGIAAGAIWGLIFLMPRVLPEFTPLELTLGRYLAYGAVSALLSAPAVRGLMDRCTRDDAHVLFRLALVGNVVYYLCVALGVQHAGVVPTSLIVGILPITITVAGARFGTGVRPLPLRRLAAPLGLVAAGVACINIDVFARAGSADKSVGETVLGLLFALGALASWTFYAVDNAIALQRRRHFTPMEWNNLLGVLTGLLAVALVPLAFALVPLAQARPWHAFMAWSVAIAIGASTISSALWNVASRRLPITLSGQLIVSETVFAAVYGFLWDDRWPRPFEIAAIALLSVGVLWSVRQHAAPQVPSDADKPHTRGPGAPA